MEHYTAVDKALDILFFLHEKAAPWGVTAIGKALGLPKSSVHRLCMTLYHRGLLERNEQGRYCTGPMLIKLGRGVLDRRSLTAVARPILRHYANTIGETFFLVGERAGALYVLDRAEGTGILRASPKVGAQLPIHATAVGKLYLAYAPDQIVQPDKKLKRFTRKTIIAQSKLQEQTGKVKQMGFAISHEEWIEGLSVVAAPILADEGAIAGRCICGAVATALMTTSLEKLGEKHIVEQVQTVAKEIMTHLDGK